MMMNANIRKVLKRIVITEKSSQMEDTYVFEVDQKSTKEHVKSAVENLFGVSVIGVRVCVQKKVVKHPGRARTSQAKVKKAYVKVAAGQNIEIENLEG